MKIGKSKEKSTGKNDSARQARKSGLGLALVFIVVGGCMFVVGVLVGRGTAPVRFDIEALQKELAELRAAYVEKESSQAIEHRHPIEAKAELEFYEALKESVLEIPPLTKTAAAPTPKAEDPAKPKIKAPPKPAPTPKAATASPPKETAGLTIQVSSVKDRKSAEQAVARLNRRGYTAYLVKADLGQKGVWYRVRVGSFSNSSAAAGTMSRLKKDGFDCLLAPK